MRAAIGVLFGALVAACATPTPTFKAGPATPNVTCTIEAHAG